MYTSALSKKKKKVSKFKETNNYLDWPASRLLRPLCPQDLRPWTKNKLYNPAIVTKNKAKSKNSKKLDKTISSSAS